MTRTLPFAAFITLCIALPLAGAQTVAPQNSDAQLALVRTALDQADQGQAAASLQSPALAKHPLRGWIEFAQLKHDIDSVSDTQAKDFLQRYGDQPVAAAFRSAWLPALARRKDWDALLANWQPTENVGLRCARLQALSAQNRADAAWTKEVQDLWSSAGNPLPDACDPLFEQLAAQGQLSDALRWSRIDAAADQGQPSVIRAAATGLPVNARTQALAYAAFLSAPGPQGLSWEKSARSQRIASDGLQLLAHKDPDTAERLLPQYTQALGLTAAQQGQVRYQIALWTVASYLPDSARRLAAVPDTAYDERLHEWQAREALARSDWASALKAIKDMPPAQRSDSRWEYFEARMLEKTGQADEAKHLYAEAAKNPTFHGFLAADKLGQPYALCPREPQDSPKAEAAVARDPAIIRAMGLWKVGRAAWANAEWNDALSRFNDDQRRIAVEVARDNGWFDRAVYGLGKKPGELQFYSLRFPLFHDATIRSQAERNALDPAWVAAEIRAESIFNPNARSHANAMGLMQLTPSTGAEVAKRHGIAYAGAPSLYDPDTNIAIGTARLRELLDTYGTAYATIAAYNAGKTPTARWLSQRPDADPDVWIETISYKETREYVMRVLAFSVIYDWRLNNTALPISDRMKGRLGGQPKSFTCPAQ